MKILVGKTAGFCWGVRRAIDKVLELREQTDEDIQTLGPLIHNPQALESLARKRIYAVENLDDITSGQVVLRSHGIAPEVRTALRAKGLKLCDGTCPRVAHIQALIKRCVRAGKTVLIAGDPGHAEVVGLMGFAGKAGFVVSCVADLAGLPELANVVLLSQTTFGTADFEAIVLAAGEKYSDIEVFETICDSTRNRQDEVRQLTKEADVMIVIGGRESANTRRLAELSKTLGTRTYQIESGQELEPSMLEGAATVAITAGASTPHWMIQRVVEKAERIARRRPLGLLKSIFQNFIASNAYVSVGAGLSTILTAALMGTNPNILYALIAACYIFAMHLLSHFADPEAVAHNEPQRMRIFKKYKGFLIGGGSLAAVCALVLAFLLGPAPGLLVLIATLAGLLYSVRVVPDRLARAIAFRRLKDIPSSKDLFVGIAWSAVTVLVPALHHGLSIFDSNVAVTFLGIFFVVYIRSVITDFKEIRGDRIVGKESLPTILGIERTRLWLWIMIAISGGTTVVLTASGLASPSFLLFLPLLAHLSVILALYRVVKFESGLTAEAVVDAAFVLAAALGAVWLAFGGVSTI